MLALFKECSVSDCRLILLDDIDVLAPEINSYSPITTFYVSNALTHGIDTIIQRHNTDNPNRRILIIATCSDRTRVMRSLLVPQRLGDITKIIRLSYPVRQQRVALIYNLLQCGGIHVNWDFHRDGHGDHVYSTEAVDLPAEEHDNQIEEKARGKPISHENNAFNLATTLSHGTQVRTHALKFFWVDYPLMSYDLWSTKQSIQCALNCSVLFCSAVGGICA